MTMDKWAQTGLGSGLGEVVGAVKSGQLQRATELILARLGGELGAGRGRGEPPERARRATMASPRLGKPTTEPEPPRRDASVRTGGASAAVGPDRVGGGAASFAWHEIASSAGTLRYKLYRPASVVETAPLPLVVMLHGCTQGADDFATGTRMNAWADRVGFLVAYPEQARAANAQRCWNWFKAGDQVRGKGEPAAIAAAVRRIIDEHAVDPTRVFVAGLSAGGAAAAIMGCAYPELFAGVGVHSGLACGAAHDLASAFTAMRAGSSSARSRSTVPTIVFHGTADRTVHPGNADRVNEQAATRVLEQEEVGRSADGTGYTRRVARDDHGRAVNEVWLIDRAGHAWSGGDPAGSYAVASGPDASREMLRFFGLIEA